MIILDGKKLAEKILNKLKKEANKKIRLAVILIGNSNASLGFIKQKRYAAKKVGVKFKLYNFDKKISEQALTKKINEIVKNKAATGVLIQLPLPKHINEQKILNLVPAINDVDALSVDNFLVEPPSASGIMKMLKDYGIRIKGKKIVIIGRGKLIGRPLEILMRKIGADLTICDSKTKNLASETLKADILISATGKPNLVKKDMVKRGAAVIDAGFSKINNKIVGDVDYKNVKNKTSYITPVPGGVGPVTVAMLMNNLIKLAKKIMKYISPQKFKESQKELEERKTILRQQISQRIQEAQTQGDITENAEYAEAKETQAFNEGRIIELEDLIKNAVIVSEKVGKKGFVQIGSKIIVKDKKGKKFEFIIVGSEDSNPIEGKISNESPMGRAFLDHRQNDEVEVITPRGKINYKIVKIK